MFSQPLLTVNPMEMMRLWGELVECYHGVSGYGSDTAEIYAYRLMPYSPVAHGDTAKGQLREDRIRDSNSTAANALVSLCEEFQRTYDCVITFDGLKAKHWLRDFGDTFDHRVHVKVAHK